VADGKFAGAPKRIGGLSPEWRRICIRSSVHIFDNKRRDSPSQSADRLRNPNNQDPRRQQALERSGW
jgi:hypothetical protein